MHRSRSGCVAWSPGVWRNPTRERNADGTAPADYEEYRGAMARYLENNRGSRFENKCDCDRFVEMVGCGEMFKPQLADGKGDNPWSKLNFCDPVKRPELFRSTEDVKRFQEPPDPGK